MVRPSNLKKNYFNTLKSDTREQSPLYICLNGWLLPLNIVLKEGAKGSCYYCCFLRQFLTERAGSVSTSHLLYIHLHTQCPVLSKFCFPNPPQVCPFHPVLQSLVGCGDPSPCGICALGNLGLLRAGVLLLSILAGPHSRPSSVLCDGEALQVWAELQELPLGSHSNFHSESVNSSPCAPLQSIRILAGGGANLDVCNSISHFCSLFDVGQRFTFRLMTS